MRGRSTAGGPRCCRLDGLFGRQVRSTRLPQPGGAVALSQSRCPTSRARTRPCRRRRASATRRCSRRSRPGARARSSAPRTASSGCCCTRPSTSTRRSPVTGTRRALMPADPRWPYYLGTSLPDHGPRCRMRRRRSRGRWSCSRMTCRRWCGSAACISIAARRRPPSRSSRARGPRRHSRSRRSPVSGRRRSPAGSTIARSSISRRVWPQDPRALSLHAPLANAYRALGKIRQAEAHLKQWRNTDVPLPDPRKDALDALLESGLSYELRGVRAMNAQDWKGAAALFRQGHRAVTARQRHATVAAPQARHRALDARDDDRGAIAEFEDGRPDGARRAASTSRSPRPTTASASSWPRTDAATQAIEHLLGRAAVSAEPTSRRTSRSAMRFGARADSPRR